MKNTKHTFTLTNLTDHFFAGLDDCPTNMDKWHYLLGFTTDLNKCVKCSLHSKHADMRTRLDWNTIFKKYIVENLQPDYKIEARKGYKLVTFIF